MADFEDFDYNKPMSLNVWKKMFPYISPEKKNLVRCLCFMVIVAIVDIIWPLMLGYIVKHNVQPQSAERIWPLLGIIVFLVSFQALNVYFFVSVGIRSEVGICRSIRNSVFLHLQKLSLSYYNKTPVG
ncbi:MAG: ABC transporter ATP-binding protein, partial [Treponema sp.]|nr:ABC transporter ATP-binding protein [Treponema sp.]